MLSGFCHFKIFPLIFAAALSAAGIKAGASVIPIGPSGFSSGAPLIDFAGLTEGLDVNGLTVNGVSFTYLIGGNPVDGALIIDGGPGQTNNIEPPNIVAVGNNTGTLIVDLAAPSRRFGYGFVILSIDDVPNATTISLYNLSNLVGSASYAGVPDPLFTGGFAGIQSTIPFTSVALTFYTQSPAFAIDNLTYEAAFPETAVPEPTTTAMTLGGLALAFFLRRSK